MRDFNVNLEKLYHNIYHNTKLLSSKFGLLKRLINQSYIDVQLLFEPSPTLTFNNLFRIDAIFFHPIIQHSIIHNFTDNYSLYNTDHQIVVCAIFKSDFITSHSNAVQKRKQSKRKIYQFDRMTDNTWADYTLKTDELIIKANLHHPSDPITMQLALNSLNDSLEQILRMITNKCIPYKWSSNTYFEHKLKSLVSTY